MLTNNIVILKALDEDMLNLSILRGEPLHDKNKSETRLIISKVKEKYPKKNIGLWTGFNYEYLKSVNDEDIKYILKNVDILIDGRFNDELYDPGLKYRGSSNQRIITREVMKNVKDA